MIADDDVGDLPVCLAGCTVAPSVLALSVAFAAMLFCVESKQLNRGTAVVGDLCKCDRSPLLLVVVVVIVDVVDSKVSSQLSWTPCFGVSP